ncbi:MAG TPA: VOC family protein [Micromonosporaceae bacterium]|nr:VOC family protein [Micromonosporaceae bacterium]
MTTHAPGTPIWVDLGTPDVESARQFYEALFGWTSTVATEPEAGGYTTFNKNGKPVAAVGPLQNEAQSPAWTTYLLTDDSEATAAKVEAAGGKVVMPPMDVLRYGRMAVFMDHAGAVFATWQPGTMAGAELFDEPGSLAWIELTTGDPEGAKAFYGDVFGWTSEDIKIGPVSYTTWSLAGKPIGGLMPTDDLAPHWMVFFAVTDPDATSVAVKKIGGTVSVPPTDMPAGRFAVLGDPAGAFFAIVKRT